MTMPPKFKDFAKTPRQPSLIKSKKGNNFISLGGVVIPISEVEIVLKGGSSKDYSIRAIIKDMDKHYLMTDQDKGELFTALDTIE